jgi:hypothetical protein
MGCCGQASCARKPPCDGSKGLLTIGIPVYDDFDGVFFTTQAILMYHGDVMTHSRIVVVDNNPDSRQGKETADYCKSIGAVYIPFKEYRSTTVKDVIFQTAETPYVLCMDSHVLVEPGAILKLLLYYQCNEGTPDLLQGPLLSENPIHQEVWTHMEPRWRGQMFGIWATDERGKEKTSPPFEIPMQGMGLFSCRRDAWVGFNAAFRGFGAEEWYIHQKFKQRGGKTLCLPFLRWVHRFRRPRGVPYAVKVEDKIRNYYIGFLELGMDTEPITNHFGIEHGVPKETLDHLLFEAKYFSAS